MKKLFAFIVVLSTGLFAQSQEFKKVWETDSLEAPESVVFNEETSEFYVSNVAGQPAEKNGMGYISKLDANGNITDKKWINGLNAPKGMAIYANQLFIADIDRVLIADINSGTIKSEYQAEGASFLNDIEVDADGVAYITDTFGGNAIYKIENESITLWLKDENLNYPNGLLVQDNLLYVSTWGVVTNPDTFETEVPGVLLAVNIESGEITALTNPFGNLDGLQKLDDNFLVSDWIAGGLLSVDKDGEVNALEDLNAGSADILYLPQQQLLLIPQMLDGRLSAYSVMN